MEEKPLLNINTEINTLINKPYYVVEEEIEYKFHDVMPPELESQAKKGGKWQ